MRELEWPHRMAYPIRNKVLQSRETPPSVLASTGEHIGCVRAIYKFGKDSTELRNVWQARDMVQGISCPGGDD